MYDQPNPEMIVLAREIRGITQSKLAKSTPSVSQGNLSRMEKGKLPISENALEEISRALEFPKRFFYEPSVKTPISAFYYRKRITVPKKVLAKLEARMDLMRMSIDRIFSDFEPIPFNIPEIDPETVSPEEAARRIRQLFKVKRGPVVNFIRLLESNGVITYPLRFETEKFDGITLITDDQNVVMFYNKDLPNERIRFTLAHELGHLVMHLRELYDRRSDDVIENEANRFAAEFLMPALDIRNDLTGLTMSNLGGLKEYWQVSMRALIYRAEALKVISKNRAQNLYIELSRAGYVKNEPGFVQLDEPKIIEDALQLLRSELNYSHEEIAENLSMHLDDFECFILQKEKKSPTLRVISNKFKNNDAASFFSH